MFQGLVIKSLRRRVRASGLDHNHAVALNQR